MIYDYYEQFSDVHPNIILKSELNRIGHRFSENAIESFKQRDDILWKGFHFFSYDTGKPTFYGDKIPNVFHISDGSVVYERTNENSPYIIDYDNGKYVIKEGDEIICDRVFFPPKPKYYDMKLEDGTPLPAIVNAISGEFVFCTFNKYCEMWNKGNECLFCDINWQFREQKKRGDEAVVARKDPSVITEVFKIIREVDSHMWMTMISGGTILGKYRGQTEIEFYESRLNAIREGCNGIWMPACCQINVHKAEDWKRLYNTGVPSIQPNIEVWNEEMFKWLCPGKYKFCGGFDGWVRQTINAVDYWGVGKVNPNFVIGVEMAKPHGFKDVKSGVENLRDGFDTFMKNGVVPRYAYWTIEPKSHLGKIPGQEVPPLQYYLEVEKAYLETRQKYGLQLPYPAAMTRFDYMLSSMQDMEFYHGNGPLSKQELEKKGSENAYTLRPGDRGYVG